MGEITIDNWNYCQYTSNNLKALVSIGASPDMDKASFIYYVTVLDENDNELSQDEFLNEKDAMSHINNKYKSIWNFNDMTAGKESDSGCSTCIAH